MKRIIPFIAGSLCWAGLSFAGPIYIPAPTSYLATLGGAYTNTIATNTVTTSQLYFGEVWGIYIEGPTAWTGNVSVATERGVTLLSMSSLSSTNGPYLPRWYPVTTGNGTVWTSSTNYFPIPFQLYGEKIKVTSTGVVPSTNAVRVLIVQK